MSRRVAWYVPGLIEGSGGLRTIFHAVAHLERAGFSSLVCAESGSVASADSLRQRVRTLYGEVIESEVVIGWPVDVQADLAIATRWDTAFYVAETRCPRKLLFAQDFEPCFSAMGDNYLLGEESYRLSIPAVTMGRWLSRELAHRTGLSTRAMDLCADLETYRPVPGTSRDPLSLCAVFQPEKPRRCAKILLAALERVHAARPDVSIVLYGSEARVELPQWVTNVGILPVTGCNELYNRSSVGVCLSSSNPSRVPFEMMAAGLPVVDLWMPNNLYDEPESACELAAPSPDGLAVAILSLLEDSPRREAMGRAGVAHMSTRGLGVSDAQLLAAVEELLAAESGLFAAIGGPERTYSRPPATAMRTAIRDVGGPRAQATLPKELMVMQAGDPAIEMGPVVARVFADGYREVLVCGAGAAGRAAARMLSALGVRVPRISDRGYASMQGGVDGCPVVSLEEALRSAPEAVVVASLSKAVEMAEEIRITSEKLSVPAPVIYSTKEHAAKSATLEARRQFFIGRTTNRYWWHWATAKNAYLPEVYSVLSDAEWGVLRAWFEETDKQPGFIGECQVPPVAWLTSFVSANNVSRIVQLGTLAGYSTLLLGWALRRMGKKNALVAVDINQKVLDFTEGWLVRAGLTDVVKLVRSDAAAQDLPSRSRELLGGDAQIVFIDSSHAYEQTLRELDLWWANVPQGALLVMHDTSDYAKLFDETGKGGAGLAMTTWCARNGVVPCDMSFSDQVLAKATNVYTDGCGLGVILKDDARQATLRKRLRLDSGP